MPDWYPLPHIQDFTRDLRGAKVFSKIDLVRAFHQMPLAEDAIPKTAVITPFGLFEFLKMPFGLCNAAQAFQRFMDLVVRGLEGVYVYIDDILVSSTTAEEHETQLRALFRRLNDHGLVVNPQKSILGAKAVQTLRSHQARQGISLLEAARELAGMGGRTGRGFGRFVELVDRAELELELVMR